MENIHLEAVGREATDYAEICIVRYINRFKSLAGQGLPDESESREVLISDSAFGRL